jgi:hypothetical protein
MISWEAISSQHSAKGGSPQRTQRAQRLGISNYELANGDSFVFVLAKDTHRGEREIAEVRKLQVPRNKPAFLCVLCGKCFWGSAKNAVA